MANEIRDAFNVTYADGPGGSPYEPPKAEVRAIGALIQTKVDEALTVAASSALPAKAAVRAVATSNVTLATSLENGDTLDGVTLVTGDRIGLVAQTAGETNGVYIVAASGTPSRATDMDSSDDIIGSRFYVNQGTTGAGTTWACTNSSAITVGTTPITFVQAESNSALGAEISAAAGDDGSLSDRFDRFRVRGGINLLKYGNLDGGPLNPLIRNGAPIVDLTPAKWALWTRGFRNAFQWGSGAEFFEFVPEDDEKASILGKYIASGFFLYDEGTPPTIAVHRVTGASDGGSTDITITSHATGRFSLGNNTYFLWQIGQLPAEGVTYLDTAADLVKIGIGFTNNVAGVNRLATGAVMAISDVEFTPADVPVLQRAAGEVALATAADGPILTLDGREPESGSIELYSGDILLKRSFTWGTEQQILLPSGTRPSWSQTADSIDGSVYRSMTDDEAPYFVNGSHMGGQHLWNAGRVTAAAHGKDATDIGQILSNGGNQYVIVGIISASIIALSRRGTSALPPTGTFTYVSGGTHATNLTVTAVSSTPEGYSPQGINRDLTMSVDSRKVTPAAGVFPYRGSVAFNENYDVLDREVVLDYIIANGDIDGLTGTPLFSVSNAYQYDCEGGLTIPMDFIAGQTITVSYIYGAQVQLSGAQYWYIPKTTAFTQDSVDYDFAMIQPAVAPVNEIQFTTSNTVAGGLFLDRFITMTDDYGMATGFLPIQDADPTERRSTFVTGANVGMSIATTGKTYLRILNQGGGSKSAGFCLSWVAYRVLFKRSPDRTCAYAVRAGEADFFFADWHDKAAIDTIELPADFHGRSWSVVEKSDTVTVLSEQLNGRLRVDVDAAGSYGYLVIRVEH